MTESVPRSTFDTAYAAGGAPWVIGEPQPAIVALAREGRITGTVLDPGCGTGEHALHLAELGYDVHGVDFSEHAVQQARAETTRRAVPAHFEVADALELGGPPRFDTVVDSALFHVFGAAERTRYTRSLRAACRPGAVVHVLALADTEPGIGPRISDTVIREAFSDGWELEELQPSRYRVAVVGPDDAQQLGLEIGARTDAAAWLARFRRL